MNEFEEQILNTIIGCEISTYTCTYAPEKAVVTISNLEWIDTEISKRISTLNRILNGKQGK